MDQALLPGIGNIQAIEALYRAGIDPRRPAKSLSQAEVNHLRKGLLDSIEFTLSSFAADGADGGANDITYVEERRSPNPFLIYGRKGEPCPRYKASSRASCRLNARRTSAPNCQK